MWQPLLTTNEKIEASFRKIAEALESEFKNETKAGLLSGLSGIALFFSYYSKYTSNKKYQALADEAIERSFGLIQENWHPVTFCSGLPGLLWGVDHLVSRSETGIEFDITETDEFVEQHLLQFAENNNLDFLHGATGILYYLLSRKDKISTNQVRIICNWFKRHAKIDDAGGISWESEVDIDNPTTVKNLSLSHGISSIIIVLCEAYERTGLTEIEELIRGAVKFLMASKNKSQTLISLYPGYIDQEMKDESSRLGWCYGDLGVGLALRRAGKLFMEEAVINESNTIFKHAAARRDRKLNFVNDAGLCHGAAGIAHIFNRLYQDSGNRLYKETALYWLDQSLQMESDNPEFLGGYQSYNGIVGWKNETQLLEGIAGVGLAYLAAVDSREPDWDKSLLIS